MINRKKLLEMIKVDQEKKAEPIDHNKENLLGVFQLKEDILNHIESLILKNKDCGQLIVFDNRFGEKYVNFLNENVAKKTLTVTIRQLAELVKSWLELEDYDVSLIFRPSGVKMNYNFGLVIKWLDVGKGDPIK